MEKQENKVYGKMFTSVFKKRLGPKFLIFLFFLLLSTILWFLNTLNRDYLTDVSIPVTYREFPEGKVLASNPPDELKLIVDGDGYSILRYRYFSRSVPVAIHVNSFSLNIINDLNPDRFYLLTENISAQLSEDLSSRFSRPLKINDIQPDSIIFEFDREVKKWVKVKPVIDIKFESQFNVRGRILSDPDSIEVSGARRFVDTLRYIKTEKKVLSQVNQTMQMTAGLNPPQNINVPVDFVELTIPVDKFTETSINVPMEVKGVPDSLYLRTFPKYVKVEFRVGLNDFEKIALPLFKATVDYNDILTSLEEKPKSMRVTLDKYPDYIKSPSLKPKTVEYIIEKK